MRFGKQVSHVGPKRSREDKRRYLREEISENDQGDEGCDGNLAAGEAETGTVGLPRRPDLVLVTRQQRWASRPTLPFFSTASHAQASTELLKWRI
jgi:hypothetical protein